VSAGPGAMKVDVSCRQCGVTSRVDLGCPAPGQSVEEYLHLVHVRWETLGD